MAEESTELPSGLGRNGLFVGQFTHALDPKRRLTIPSAWRDLVGGELPQLFVMPGVLHKNLCVYPAKEIHARVERIRRLSLADAKGRQFARTLASQSDIVAWDTQGRIRVRDELLSFAGLKDQVVLVGTFDGFEMWSPEGWRDTNVETGGPGLLEATQYVGF